MISPLFEPGLWVGLVTLPCASLLLISHHLWTWETPLRKQFALVGIWTMAGAVAWHFTGSGLAWGGATIGLLLSWVMASPLRHYYLAAQILVPTLAISLVTGLGWSLAFIQSLAISPLTRNLLLANLVVGLVFIPFGLMTLLPTQSYLLRKRWLRPRYSLAPQPRHHYPKVSFHVPCYAEPPEVVCATLDALSQIRYPNFEVLLVDNNTRDPALWHPLQTHCQQLNQQLAFGLIPSENLLPNPFRFFHVERLPGAKAGALNFALERAAPDAELIAIIDADYQAQPDFLQRLVGFFDNPNLGFVQTPHDYRGWEDNVYQRACYWEYMLFFRLQLSCLSEWMASYVIGTMCVIRRCALEQAGGWSTWCLTEDSESAVRIHALGYDSIFLTETFGRGLIPETFRGYKKQRLRWTIGPIQQLFQHWHLYLPDPWATPSRLSFWQRVLELSHSLGGLQPILGILFLPLGAATLASILRHQEIIPIPMVLWWGIGLVGIAALLNGWLNYRLLGCTAIPDMLMSTLASLSLGHIRFMGAFLAIWRGRSLAWQRTNKFKMLPDRFKALGSVKTESCLALLFLLLGSGLMGQASWTPPDLILGLSLGMWGGAIVYLSAPVMALLAEHQLRHPPRPQQLLEQYPKKQRPRQASTQSKQLYTASDLS
jgi:cellulose synthase/poly-beta-1,6-N-acetylglucosamine synthase-like glycosyltransferase